MPRPSTKGFSRNVYVSSKHDSEEERKFEPGSEQEKLIRQFILEVVEKAFRKYAKAHSADVEMENKEWTRFRKILNGML